MSTRKIIMLIILPFFISGIFYPGVFANIVLYFFNGSSLKVNNYTINFPLAHWAYFSKSENGFELSGKKIDSIYLEATIHEFDKPLTSVLTKLCDDLVYEENKFETISLKIYTCILQDNRKTIYFQTLDNILVIETHTYVKNNKNIVSEFDLLLNSITFRSSHVPPKL
jgi:hypothetical protein